MSIQHEVGHGCGSLDGGLGENPISGGLLEQRCDVTAKGFVIRTLVRKKALALTRRQRLGGVKQILHALPALTRHH